MTIFNLEEYRKRKQERLDKQAQTKAKVDDVPEGLLKVFERISGFRILPKEKDERDE